MSIELLQTMEWSKLCWDLSFEELIELDLILPKVGSTYTVKLSTNEDHAKEGRAFLLWQPPHSELNGWRDGRPSEILKSHVIEGVFRNAIHGNSVFDFDVIFCTKLVDYFSKVSEEKASPLSYIGQPEGASVFQWRDARSLVKSNIGKYLYLSGSECETSLDAILSYDGSRLCLHYSATLHHPASYQTIVTKYYLNQYEHIVFEQLLAQAEEIIDDSMLCLDQDKIKGAEYW
ncbi:hypothetical protein [Chitinimonas taiwanensis]|uniref:Uncharacterized protein n=1 Tax=Chitinimonas taiwanensis DSM 18899 TaxID=1121279 RepID=A0A1K2H5G6_9NEIS|nr:hypothetical protein [Chitinimonas taiwanensis]SFZ70772.1 hypothetical protein SAMN02745887_00307 [Chitinimonas taiwanensis DSM 18899]